MARRSALWALPIIVGLVSGVYVACFAVAAALRLPTDLALPWAFRVLGVVPLAYAACMLAWVLRFRGPSAMIESTWLTLLKLLRQMPVESPGGRTESLVVAGPYRVVRHPLYSGVDGLTLGIAMLVDHPWAYLGAVALGLWFALILAPFEERELLALFGQAYRTYMESVRRFLPLPRRPAR